MSEDERRELIARQRSALYEGHAFSENGTPLDESSHSAPQVSGRGPSPLVGPPSSAPDVGQAEGADSTSSPSSNQAGNFSLFETAQQSSRTSASSPTGGSPPRQGKPSAGNVAPIGTRPAQATNSALNKQRATTPLPSPLSYGYSSEEAAKNNGGGNNVDRSTSASSNPSTTPEVGGLSASWGTKSGVWGGKNSLGMQASVWG